MDQSWRAQPGSTVDTRKHVPTEHSNTLTRRAGVVPVNQCNALKILYVWGWGAERGFVLKTSRTVHKFTTLTQIPRPKFRVTVK